MADQRRRNFSVYNTEEMQKRKKKVVKKKLKKDRFIAIMTILFIVVYLSYALINFLTLEELTYVTAVSGNINEITSVPGVITRNENVVSTNLSGYIEYLYIEGEKIPTNSVVARISDQYYGTIIDTKIEDVNNEILTSSGALDTIKYNDELIAINKDIEVLLKNYVTLNESKMFDEVYDLSKELDGLLYERYETYIVENNKALNEMIASKEGYEKQLQSTHQLIVNDQSGIISYSYDGYEALQYQNMTRDFLEEYENTNSDIRLEPHEISKDTLVYKFISSQDWYLTIFMEEPWDYEIGDRIEVSINEDIPIRGQLIEYGSDKKGYKATLAFNDRIHDYLNHRIVDVTIDEVSIEGIKIPNSCFKDNELLGIPYSYILKSNGIKGVIRRGVEEDEFIQIDIVYTDQDYAYIERSKSLIQYNDLLIPDQKEASEASDYRVNYSITIPGVYVVNKGYEEFRVVEVIYQNDEYAIIANNTSYGVRTYDRILLNNEE
ncbi:HlyD family efflux transporter periplasmic adaptor subunit [Vallitalea okinawensis]|uniref:HlyD family efflux transporter periplasmic adaptor subunit n=1 Tax=Vallitalea okinawensis TaxID=2078660 RepID=UPI000CFB7C28|nr:HlyD family efflux transporter periplasmic adaptor subunit [Vallitalea okinawensis]